MKSSRQGRFERQLRSPGGDVSGLRFARRLSLPGAAAGRGDCGGGGGDDGSGGAAAGRRDGFFERPLRSFDLSRCLVELAAASSAGLGDGSGGGGSGGIAGRST